MEFIDADNLPKFRKATGTGTDGDPFVFVYRWDEVLSYLYDSIDVAKMSKGAIIIAHDAITATTTSAEIDCRGYNSLLVAWSSDATDKTWTIGLIGSMTSGGTFVAHLDAAGAAIVYTTDKSGWYTVTGIPDYVKIVATEVDDGATVSCSVQPFNV